MWKKKKILRADFEKNLWLLTIFNSSDSMGQELQVQNQDNNNKQKKKNEILMAVPSPLKMSTRPFSVCP